MTIKKTYTPFQKAKGLQKRIRKTAIKKRKKDRGETTKKPNQ